MRIVGNIEHPILRITIFSNDNRLSVKFESGLFEQTYKFRDGEGIDKPDDIRRLVEGPFTASVLEQLQRMSEIRSAGLQRMHLQDQADEFDVII
jgi:hypothetical protein